MFNLPEFDKSLKDTGIFKSINSDTEWHIFSYALSIFCSHNTHTGVRGLVSYTVTRNKQKAGVYTCHILVCISLFR